MEPDERGMIQVYNWTHPLQPVQLVDRFLPYKDWLDKERRRFEASGRMVEIRRRGKDNLERWSLWAGVEGVVFRAQDGLPMVWDEDEEEWVSLETKGERRRR